MNRPAIVTGMGIIAPTGIGTEAYWQATLAGHTGIRLVTRFDSAAYPVRLAGQVEGFDAARYLSSRLLPQTDISTQFALTAAAFALADAGANTAAMDEYQMAVVTANASGGFEFTHREFRKLWSEGPEYVSVYESFAWFYAVNTGQISIRHGARGPSRVLVAEQAGGLDALGHARRTIRRDTALVIAGGVDSALDPWGWVSHAASGRLSADPDPGRAYRPFARDACGYLPGEGGAILVMEDAEAARHRAVPYVYGEIAGYAASFDPPPGSSRPSALRRAAEQAIADAGLAAADIGAVFADAAGILALDRAEADAITGIFGPCGVPVVASKSGTGRLYSGGGPLDVATALLSLRDGILPPSSSAAEILPQYHLDLVQGEPRVSSASAALVLGRGRWGFNAAMVVRRAEA